MAEPVIAVLPAHVIDQIAAGEVIERPASVVKELVDNAIDAGARTIAIDTAAGGRGLVRVSDDGCGMGPGDAVLAFERHATSKLRAVDDLWALRSMGFRGEALPSIASVARVTLTTRREGDLAATRVVVEAGAQVSLGEVGAPAGTTVEVADLLYNLPARLKFLKGESTEASHITELVARLAMAHPELHLRLRHNGRTALDLPPDRDGFARACALLGPRIASRLIQVSGEEAGVRVIGYLGAPELAQTTARGVQLFVGRRPVRDRGLLHAIAMGYGELVPRGRYPIAIVLVDVPVGAVDVNVHPQKLEVRFGDAAAVSAAVRHVIAAGVAAAPWRSEPGAASIQMTAIASAAPPALPFDGRPPTALAQRYARELRMRDRATTTQGSLGFEPPPRPPPAPAGHGSPRAWVESVRERGRVLRAAERDDQVRIDRGERAADAAAAAAHAAATAPVAAGGQVAAGQAASGHGAADHAAAGHGAADHAAAAHADADHAAAGHGAADHADADHAAADHADADHAAADHAAVRHADADHAAARHADAAHAAARHADADHAAARHADAVAAAAAAAASATASATHTGYFARLRYLGQLDLTYLVCESDGELVLVDQHSAHERVALARLRARHTARDVAIQKLLFPVTIDAPPEQLALVERLGSLLAQVGFEAEAFGRTTLAIKSVPAGIRHGDPAQLLRDLLETWARDGSPDPATADDERLDHVLATIACHSVVRAGDRLVAGEAEALLRALDGVALDGAAPHGRALLLRLPLAEIGRRFGR